MTSTMDGMVGLELSEWDSGKAGIEVGSMVLSSILA